MGKLVVSEFVTLDGVAKSLASDPSHSGVKKSASSSSMSGSDGGLGTSWYTDPREDMVTILMTQRARTLPG